MLGRSHIHPHLLTTDGSAGMGVLCFSTMTMELQDQVRQMSRNGVQRVLALAGKRAQMPDGAAWTLLRAGASDVLAWDGSPQLAQIIPARFERWQAVDAILDTPLVRNSLVGQSPVWIAALRQIVEVAHFTDASILITGETGTGKELVGRLTHTLDPRRDKRDLIVLDCTTIVPELAGSEFWGHERGAFTNAVAARDGAFALADGGTLFLDEVGELPPALQPQLLRVVQEHTYKRVGSNTWRQSHFRLVCATHRDLLHDVASGQFRRDLYHRIATWTCRLPPLRERVDDILPLAEHIMRQAQPDQEPPVLDPSVRAYLLTREYPGNVRDLKQCVLRMWHRHVGPGPMTVGDIPPEEWPVNPHDDDWPDAAFEQPIRQALARGVGLKDLRRMVDDLAIRMTINDEQGNLQRAAQRLGVTDRALQIRQANRRHALAPDAADSLN
ncbi:MAG TPA: sigma 54-interacting transcriptional regulator [Herpetosiphonaceae bacterium]